jgi:hypothetical protein
VARNKRDTCVLVEAEFDFICDWNGQKIFRKRKYRHGRKSQHRPDEPPDDFNIEVRGVGLEPTEAFARGS